MAVEEKDIMPGAGKTEGDDGMTTLENAPEANRYSNYMTYLELKKFKWDDAKIAQNMNITTEELFATIEEFGSDDNEE